MNELNKLRAKARAIYNQIEESYSGLPPHSSHIASEALEQAAKELGFDHYGVEGFCNEAGSKGISYLNTGDTYARTVYAVCSRFCARFYVGDQEKMQSHKL